MKLHTITLAGVALVASCATQEVGPPPYIPLSVQYPTIPSDYVPETPATTLEDAEKLSDWAQLISARIHKFWTRPPLSPDRFRCSVKVDQRRNGEVLRVLVMRSCGTPSLDRSLELAVVKASPLPLPADPTTPFFSVINVTFCPREGCDQ